MGFRLPLAAGPVRLTMKTRMPDHGRVSLTVDEAAAPFTLRLRIPRWAARPVTVRVNGTPVGEFAPGYATLENVSAGDEITFTLPMTFRMTQYTGGEEIIGKERWAMEYGPLLYAAMGASVVQLNWNPRRPSSQLRKIPGTLRFAIKDDPNHEYWPYIDIHDEPFSVYPAFDKP